MNPATRMSTNPWLYAGLAGLPTTALFAVCVIPWVFAGQTTTSIIPSWAWFVASLCLPVSACTVGLGLAYFLSKWQNKVSRRPLTRVYTAFFTVAWNVIFGYLSLFTFAMGLGDCPAATSMAEFGHRVFGVIVAGLPIAVVISLIVCSVATALLIAVLEILIPQSS